MTANVQLTRFPDPSLTTATFDELLALAVEFHGHLCPGQVLGVRMVIAGCRELGFDRLPTVGKRLDRRRVRVTCEQCGEDVNYQREIVRRGRTLCRACAGDAYYVNRLEG